MKKLIKKYSPPGLELFPEILAFVVGNILSVSILSGVFTSNFIAELSWIKDSPSRNMPYFSDMIQRATIGFAVTSGVLICFMIYRYMYLIRTKSIYLTKRLPVWRSTEKLCLYVPVGYMFSCILIEKITLIILFVCYYVITPEQNLKNNVLFDFIMESLL